MNELPKLPMPGKSSAIEGDIIEPPREPELERLITAFRDKNYNDEARRTIAITLGKMRSNEALSFLVEALQEREISVRHYAALALGVSESAGAVEPLIEALADAAWEVRIAAAWALGELGHKRALPTLEYLSITDKGTISQKIVATAITKIKRAREENE